MSTNDVHDAVRERYAEAAREAAAGEQPGIVGGCGEGGCCAPSEAVFGSALYEDADRGDLPEAAVLASLGCGNPAAVAELREGEVVSISAPGAASTSCCPRAGLGRPARRTAST